MLGLGYKDVCIRKKRNGRRESTGDKGWSLDATEQGTSTGLPSLPKSELEPIIYIKGCKYYVKLHVPAPIYRFEKM